MYEPGCNVMPEFIASAYVALEDKERMYSWLETVG